MSPLVASPVFGKPTLAIREVRNDPLDTPPEPGTVVGFYEVDELVDDHVLHHTGRKTEGAPVEVELPPWAARAPAIPQLPDGYGDWLRSYPTRRVGPRGAVSRTHRCGYTNLRSVPPPGGVRHALARTIPAQTQRGRWAIGLGIHQEQAVAAPKVLENPRRLGTPSGRVCGTAGASARAWYQPIAASCGRSPR